MISYTEELTRKYLVDVYEQGGIDLVSLDEALNDLENLNPRQSRVVQLRWFSGMTVSEVADVLNVSVSTVESDWRMARAFLLTRLSDD